MSEQEVEEQISSEETLDDETGEDNGTPDKASGNKSNFKKMSESLKSERVARQEAEKELNEWRSLNPDIDISSISKKSDGIDKGDLALFLVQNPEAKGHLDEVKEYLAEMKNPDLEKAWKYVKPTIALESKDSTNFSIKNNSKPVKKDLVNMSLKDAYENLSPEERKEWRKLHPEQ